MKFFQAAQQTKPNFDLMVSGQVDKVDLDMMIPFHECLSEQIAFQKKRIGGDFVIAHAVMNRKQRDAIKKILPECIFVVMSMDEKTQKKRIVARHGEGEESQFLLKMLVDMYKLYEGPGSDEEGTLQLDITEDMTPTDVLNKVLDLVK